jgi:hypothetical protein
MEINDVLRNMAKGLVLHYLHRRTVDAAVAEGKEAGLPSVLVECFPGVMFQVTIAAAAVHTGQHTFNDMIGRLIREGARKEDAESLTNLALDFMRELRADGGEDRPVPDTGRPWFHFGMGKMPTLGGKRRPKRRAKAKGDLRAERACHQ